MQGAASRELWRAAFRIADRSFSLEESERDAFLARACAGQTELLERVEVLLREPSNASGGPSEEESFGAGQNVAGYRLLRKLGAGGMGVVFEAECETTERKVALKLLEAATVGEEARRRFRLEIKLLGSLDHPSIADLYDAGETDAPDGRRLLYYAMELVRGATDIVAYAERRSLAVRERLGLFLDVCDAVAYGHARKIVHRDIKPGNLLVDEEGRVRVIDYGIARSLDAEPWTSAPNTRSGAILGTLGYMAPEQLAADRGAVDARADVYSLGIVLYELLTGRPAFDLHGASLVDSLDRVRNAEVPPPSAQSPRLSRELDWIVAKCTERALDRRYGSVEAISIDVRRFLSGVTLGRPAPRMRLVVRTVMPALGLLALGFLAGHWWGGTEDAEATRGSRTGGAVPIDRLRSRPYFPQLAAFGLERVAMYEEKVALSNPDIELQERIDGLMLPSVQIPPTFDPRRAVDALEGLPEGLEIVWDSRALREAEEWGASFELELRYPTCLTDVLDLLLEDSDLAWNVRDGAIFISSPDRLHRESLIVNYPVQDLLGVPAPAIGLVFDWTPPYYFFEVEDLVTTIMENIAPDTWGEDGVGCEVGDGFVLFAHRPDVQLEIESFLAAYRRSLFSQERPRVESWTPAPSVSSVRRHNAMLRRDGVWMDLSSRLLPDLSFASGEAVTPSDLVEELQSKLGMNVIMSVGLRDELDDDAETIWYVDYREMTVLDFLNDLSQPWSLRGGVLAFGEGWMTGVQVGRIFDITRLLTPFEDPDAEFEEDLSDEFEERETAIITPGQLEDIIRNNIHPVSWDADPSNSIRITADGRLIVTNRPEVVREIDALLRDLEIELINPYPSPVTPRHDEGG